MVAASRPGGRSPRRGVAMLMVTSLGGQYARRAYPERVTARRTRSGVGAAATVSSSTATSGHLEALAREPVDVVRQAHQEDQDHQHEADHPGALHHAERHGVAPDLILTRPEVGAAIGWELRLYTHVGERGGEEREDAHPNGKVNKDRVA